MERRVADETTERAMASTTASRASRRRGLREPALGAEPSSAEDRDGEPDGSPNTPSAAPVGAEDRDASRRRPGMAQPSRASAAAVMAYPDDDRAFVRAGLMARSGAP
jgi:hypothetical protein